MSQSINKLLLVFTRLINVSSNRHCHLTFFYHEKKLDSCCYFNYRRRFAFIKMMINFIPHMGSLSFSLLSIDINYIYSDGAQQFVYDEATFCMIVEMENCHHRMISFVIWYQFSLLCVSIHAIKIELEILNKWLIGSVQRWFSGENAKSRGWWALKLIQVWIELCDTWHQLDEWLGEITVETMTSMTIRAAEWIFW